MGCGASKEDANGVLNNLVTQNGSAHHNSNSASSVNKDQPTEPIEANSPPPAAINGENKEGDPEQDTSASVPETNDESTANSSGENNESLRETKEETGDEEKKNEDGIEGEGDSAPMETNNTSEKQEANMQNDDGEEVPQGDQTNGETQGPETETVAENVAPQSEDNSGENNEMENCGQSPTQIRGACRDGNDDPPTSTSPVSITAEKGSPENGSPDSEKNENDPESAEMESPERLVPADESFRDEVEDGLEEKQGELERSRSRNSTTSSTATIISSGASTGKESAGDEKPESKTGASSFEDDDSGVVADNGNDEIPKTEETAPTDCSDVEGEVSITTSSPSPTIKERRKAAEENDTCDLNLDDPDLEKAATRIQAAFRGHTTRKQITPKMAEGEEVIDIDLNDPEVGVAATKIQASFRGHKARREAEKADKAKADAELSKELQKLKTTEEKPAAEDEEDLPDLNDPEVNKAATKIQAHFKGHLVRKTTKAAKDGDASN